jgi:hypothetical protein
MQLIKISSHLGDPFTTRAARAFASRSEGAFRIVPYNKNSDLFIKIQVYLTRPFG